MTYHFSNLAMTRIVNSLRCPRCCDPKLIGQVFCNNCFEKLPKDLVGDLYSPNNYVKVAAYADATQYLMHEWR
jgi:hypothetical protein